MERSQTETLGTHGRCPVVLELVRVGLCVATNDPSAQTPGLLQMEDGAGEVPGITNEPATSGAELDRASHARLQERM